MAKKPATNKLWEPFSYVPPGTCPKCGKPTMVMTEHDTIHMLLDEDGIPTCPVCNSIHIFTCMTCGFNTGEYVATDKGYRYAPDNTGEYIKEINRIPRSINNPNHNPFIKQETKS